MKMRVFLLIVCACLLVVVLFYSGQSDTSGRDGDGQWTNDGMLPDGTVVLLTNATGYKAFVLEDQSSIGLRFRWFSANGADSFDTDREEVQSGVSSGDGVIRFHDVAVLWHCPKRGFGKIYYDNPKGSSNEYRAQGMCIVGVTNVADLNPSDPEWVYKYSP